MTRRSGILWRRKRKLQLLTSVLMRGKMKSFRLRRRKREDFIKGPEGVAD